MQAMGFVVSDALLNHGFPLTAAPLVALIDLRVVKRN
jgi:hypothetical protein